MPPLPGRRANPRTRPAKALALALLALAPAVAPGAPLEPPARDAPLGGGAPADPGRELVPLEPAPLPDLPRPLAGATDDPPPAVPLAARATLAPLHLGPGVPPAAPLDDVGFTLASPPARAPEGGMVPVPPLATAATAPCVPALHEALPSAVPPAVRKLLSAPLPCPPPLPDAPPVAFVVDTRVTGSAPRRTPGLVGVPVPVDADGRPTTGVGGVDLTVTALPRLTLDGVRLRIETVPRPDALPAAGRLADLDLRVRIDLSGTPPLGVPGPARPFVDVGYRGGPPPQAFELEATWGEVGAGDALADVHLDIRPSVPRLTVLASFYTAVALDAPRDPSTDVAVGLDGLGAEGSRFTAGFTLHQLADPAPATVLDWRAPRAVDADVVVTARRGADEATTRIAVQGLPARVGLSAAGSEPLAIALDASAAVPRLEVDLDRVAGGGPRASTRVAVTSLPRHAFLTLTASGLAYRGSAPLGVVDVVTTDRGAALRLPGDHAAVLEDGAGRSVSARVTGLRSLAFEAAEGALRVHARLAAARPFDVLIREPGLEASVAIRDLPTDVEVRFTPPGAVAYRADATVGRVSGTFARGPLAVAFTLEGLPERLDVAFAPEEGRVLATLSAPLDLLEVRASHAEGFANTSYRHARVRAEAFPGIAAAWAPDGSALEVQATPPGEPVGLAEVALSATGAFPSRPESVHAVLDTRPGREAVAARLVGFLAARVRLGDDLTAQLDLAAPATAGVTVLNDTLGASLRLEDLPASVRLDTDLATRVAYQASQSIGSARLTAHDRTSGDALDVLAQHVPRALVLLMDPAAGTASLSTGAGTVGFVRVLASSPGGLGGSGFRSLAVEALRIPGFTASWSPEGAAFATDGRAIGVVRAAFSTEPRTSAPSSPTGDFVHVLDHTASGGERRILAQVTGLVAARVRAAPDGLEGGLELAAPRPFDAVYSEGDPSCPAREAVVAVRDLPSFSFATDLRGFLDYQASEPIASVNLTMQEFQRVAPGLCIVTSSIVAGVGGIPDALRVDWASDPASVAYRASAPIPVIDLDVYGLRRDVQRVEVAVRNLSEGLAFHLSPAGDHAVLQASAPVGLVDAVASSLANPTPRRDAALAHEFDFDRRPDGEWLVYAKVTGLSGARFAQTAGGVAATLEAAPGAFQAHVRDEGGEEPVEVVVTANDLPARTSLSTDGASLLHADFSARVGLLEIRACLGNALDACRSDGTLLFARALQVPTRLHLDITPSGATFDLAEPMDLLSFELHDRDGLDGSGAPGAIRQVKLTLHDLNSGRLEFGDPHAVVIEFGQPVGIDLLVTPIPDFFPPIVGAPTEAFVNVFLPPGQTTPVAHLGLGRRAGEGVRAFRAIMDENPARIEAELALPDLAVMAWSAWDRVPASYLRIERPPASLSLETWTTDPVYPLRGVSDSPGFYRYASHLTPDRLREGPSDTPTASDWRINLTASADSGPVRFWLVTGGENNRTRDGQPDYVHVDLDRIPAGTSRVQMVTDPRVHDLNRGGRDGSLLAVDVTFAAPVILNGSAFFGGTGVRLRPSFSWAPAEGPTTRLFFGYWQSFSTERLSIGVSGRLPHVWAGLRVDGRLRAEVFNDATSHFRDIPGFEAPGDPFVKASFRDAHALLFVTTDHNWVTEIGVAEIGTTCWRHLGGITEGHVSGHEVWTLGSGSAPEGCDGAV